MIRQRTFESFHIGETASVTRLVTEQDVDRFAELSGDDNPLHMSADFAHVNGMRDRVVHGMLVSAWISRALGTVLPGPGCLWLSQDSKFPQPVYPGDTLEIRLKILHKSDATRVLVVETTVLNQRGETVVTGEAKVTLLNAPAERQWQDMTVLVTGGSRGIGREIALALGCQGARVVVNYHSRRECAEAVVETIRSQGGQAVAVQADVTSVESTEALADAAVSAFGQVDVLVNNATPEIVRRPFDSVTWADLDTYWRSYVQSSFVLAQKLLPGMKQRQFGRIVQILSSAVSGQPPAEMVGYVTVKSALWGFTRALAVEAAPFGVTVNAVSPSAVMTDQWNTTPETRRRAMAMRTPLRRIATTHDVARAVLYLVGPGGDFVTGANLPVNGGEVMY